MGKRRKVLLQLLLLLPIYLLVKTGQLPLRLLQQAGKLVPRPGLRRHQTKVTFMVMALIFLAYTLGLAKLAVTLVKAARLTPTDRPLTTQVFDRQGELLYQFYEDKNRKLVQLEDLPPYLLQATIAIEDQRFYSHPGIDPLSIARALWLNFTSPKKGLQGGSTITQQLIKNTLLSSERTVSRKLQEAILALLVERLHSKGEILQMYFNEAPYGGPAWGIEAAAEMYFGKEAPDLTLAESAYLAGLPAAPTRFSPYGIHPEQGRQRQKEVLRRMVEEGFISPDEADQAGAKELHFTPPVQNIKAPHFVMYLRFLLAEKYGEKAVSSGGLKVYTTLDLKLQEQAEKTITRQLNQLKSLHVGNGAAVVEDAQNGEILAMVGSKDYFDPSGGNYNVALALRSPGSSIKVITYAAAFKEGYSPGTILLDTPVTFPAKGPWEKPYSPVNYDNYFHGPVSIRTALGSSYNIPAVKTLQTIGIPAMLATAREMGITTLSDTDNYGLSLTLGGGGVKLLEMVTVYGTLASGGIRHDPQPILKVIDASGKTLEDNSQGTTGRRVLTKEVAYLLSNILSDNNARTPAFGASSLLKIPGHNNVAVKTGTSDKKVDNWTFGYTPQYVVGVWVGNMDNSPMDPHLVSGITGAAPIWHEIMESLLSGQPDTAFNRPPGIVETTVDGHKDLAISGVTPKTAFSDRFSGLTATPAAQVIPTQTTQ